ncbi:MAG: anaerobic nitric oxide reductase flavorubredoxin [Succiniclasticum sp.]|jgi:flavorubredoxin|nr:anaerobic nitric oxide reductase flavorubredoxin [Succiniclasticum sp.]MCI6222843.1 anaerobic nitric oxide reductase flavorubredoxin [Selenomonadales bacterium]MDY6304302.1 anaerobic nitric oxide reductase flavorubredoxin [Succiniclasticum sp.]MDY6345460.1 anaerobic nitric oxide reductase flavorubredoxin [Succiniclasticum sp.]
MSKKISERVTWVGKIDWELVFFHGHELSTFRGSSYNSYLIRDQKTVLVDTAWKPYDEEFVANLKKEIDLRQIDAIVMNHNEIDHSGALPALLREIPGTPVYCTKKGEAILRGMYHQDWNYVNVKTGDVLDLGETQLHFIEAPMLHWPDTMFSYLTGENILFSTDAFGQHFASEELFDDTCDLDTALREALKYYANIITMFNPMAMRKLKEIAGMNLPVRMICPSHGVIWRRDPQRIFKLYEQWAANYQENQITVIYDTMWNSTRHMADAIVKGMTEADPTVVVKELNCARTDKSDIITEVMKSKGIIVGSPTINNGLSYYTAGILELIHGCKFKNKKAAAFGSYGWSGESPKQITASLEHSGFTIVQEGLGVNWNPDQDKLAACEQFGRDFVKAFAG